MTRALLRSGFSQVLVRPFDFLHPAFPDRLANAADTFGKWLERVPLVSEFAGSLFIHARRA
jgi:hypothetical protein